MTKEEEAEYLSDLMSADHSKKIQLIEKEIHDVIRRNTKNGLMPFIAFDIHADTYNFSPWVVKMCVADLSIAPLD